MSGFRLAEAQQFTVRGTLQTKSGKAVTYASVMVNNATTNQVIAFQSSDENGAFMLQLPPGIARGDLVLEINHLGYRRVRQALKRGNNTYNILLEEQAIPLAEVEVKSGPVISSRGDTLSYDVGSFAKNEDRSIEDVIKRLPGMEVGENGQIKFNGKNISNLYIDGDDLLDDKYAIGTKTIPYAMVKGVEVLQNHQPLKVLKNKVFSDQIAVNLVIKEEAKLKLTAQAKVGAGLPEQYNGELNAMLFNKKYKMLNVVKGNNIGDDLKPDFKGFNQSSFMSEMGNGRPRALLSPGTANAPALPKNTYYFNHSGSVNANNLINYTNGLQVKSAIKMFVDKNQLSYNNQAEFYSDGDTIRYRERQYADNRPFIADINLNARFNKETYFFNNSLSFVSSKETDYSSLQSDEIEIAQRLGQKVRDFSNHLEYVPELKNKNIISVNWYLNYFNQPQNLLVHPGINASIFNAGKPFESLDQFAETPTWFNRATLGYRFTNGMVKQYYQTGIINELQELNSRLRLHQLDGSQTSYQASQDNGLRWSRNQFFVNGSYEYKKGKVETRLSIPIILQRIAYRDDGFEMKESKDRLFFNPGLHVRYKTSVEDYVAFNYTFKNETGNINDVFRGAVLSNYRTLHANDAALQEQESHTVGTTYHFKRSIHLFFVNVGASYKKTRANTIASAIVSDNISQTVLLPLANEVNSFRANGGISKFIFALGATTSLNASWSMTRFNQLFNKELLPFNDIVFTLNPEIEARLLKRIALNYKGTASWVNSKQLMEEHENPLLSRQIQNFDQSLTLSYSPYRNTFIKVNGRYQFSKRPAIRDVHYFFSDVHLGYKIKRWRTDIELDLTNLSNVRTYETYGVSANRFDYNRYQLRGRMIMLRTVFNL